MTGRDYEWHEYILPGNIPVLAKRCLSRVKYVDTMVVAVHRADEMIGIYHNQAEDVQSVLLHAPTKVIQDNDLRIPVLYEILYREDVERIFGELEAEPFYEAFPSTLYIYEIIRKLSEVRLPGWIYTSVSCRGIALLKDFDSFADGTHVVGVTDAGVAVYQSSIKTGGSLCSDDRIFYLGTDHINIEALARLCCWPHAQEICNVHRSLRRWIFHTAVESE